MAEALRQIDAFTTPGTLLKAAREAKGLSAREAADRLHMMPDYVGILESDNYQALRSPAFARGYLKAYCRLLGVEEREVLALYDRTVPEHAEPPVRQAVSRPLPLQRTGVGVVIGLTALVLLVGVLWWQGSKEEVLARPALEPGVFPEEVQVLGGEAR